MRPLVVSRRVHFGERNRNGVGSVLTNRYDSDQLLGFDEDRRELTLRLFVAAGAGFGELVWWSPVWRHGEGAQWNVRCQ